MKLLTFLAALIAPIAGFAGNPFITLASTTSTQNSGLYDQILPQFTDATGIDVRVVAVGTGQAIRIAQNGDADVLLVHHRPSEDAFVKNGYGLKRYDVMYNDFVIVGPANDPAAVRSANSVDQAMQMLDDIGITFVSRGDESGTHKKERSLWAKAGRTPQGQWYREIGAGMGAALNMASAMDGYTLTDRGTWLSFQNRGNLELLFSGQKSLLNPYGAIVVNPTLHPHVKADMAQRFVDWLISESGQKAIGDVRVAGKQLFCPNAEGQKTGANKACPAS